MLQVSQKRIAKNAVFLYLRLLFVIAVQLFTVRIVLNALGAEDYGIYTVVGGVVTLFTFLNGTMTGSTQRFFNIEMGKGSELRLKETFNAALYCHGIICILIFILAETIGLWLVNKKLIVPESKHLASIIVYQLSVVSVLILTISVPYNALIIAHEKMHVYAIAEIFRALFMLAGAYMVLLFNSERLILYAILVLIANSGMSIVYIVYCRHKFNVCVFSSNVNKDIIRPLLSFSGWDLYGNMCVSARTQGINILLNVFFGTVVNAASGIATSIQTYLVSFGNNVVMAFRPQIIQQYAIGDYSKMQELVCNALKFSLLLFGVIAVPLYVEMPFILKLWLKNVPEFTAIFAKITILMGFVQFIIIVINIMIHATGKIKGLSIISGSWFLMNLPIAYMLLQILDNPVIVFWSMLAFLSMAPLIGLIILHCNLPQINIKQFLIEGLLKVIIILTVGFFIIDYFNNQFDESFVRLISEFSIFLIFVTVSSYYSLLPTTIRRNIYQIIADRCRTHK